MKRRTLLLAPLTLLGQSRKVSAVLISGKGSEVPPELRGDSVVFPRAYLGCVGAPLAHRILSAGKYAHLLRPDEGNGFDKASVIQKEVAFDSRELPAALKAYPLAVYTGFGDGGLGPGESSIHVPLAIRYPGVLKPRVEDEVLASHVDVLPTLHALCGLSRLPGWAGTDLFAPHVDSVYLYSVYVQGLEQQWRAVIRGFDKLVVDRDGNPTHLYNLADDPGEGVNLVRESASQLTRDSLLAVLRSWRRRTNDGLDASGLKRR